MEQLPMHDVHDLSSKCAEDAKDIFYKKWKLDNCNELSPCFITWCFPGDLRDSLHLAAQTYLEIAELICSQGERLDEQVAEVFGLQHFKIIQSPFLRTRPKDTISVALNVSDANSASLTIVDTLIHYLIGCIYGRWDVRIALDKSLSPKLPGPFDPLPVCPPGMLVGPDGLSAEPSRIVSEEWLRARPDANTLPLEDSLKIPAIPEIEYPLRVSWDGILADDPGHEDDIVRRVRDVLEVIWKDRAEAIEREACEILGVRELRDYFRKPGNGGFWMDHVKRYSKSRRKAPIYWYLRSAKGNYGLWLYYHRLDKDILFKALLNYVEPKIRLEEDRLKSFRGRKEAAGSSGREAKQIEKDMDRQEQFVSELHDFADKLRRAANLHLIPDLNDGVVLTIAPLYELVPWKEAKDYWEDLVAGKYEWSSIGKQLREKGLVKI